MFSPSRSSATSRRSASGDSSESTAFTLRSNSHSPVTPVLQRPVRELTPGERVSSRLPKLNPNVNVFKPCMTELALPDISNLNLDNSPSTPGPTQKAWSDLNASPAIFGQNVTTPSSSTTFELRTPQTGTYALPDSAVPWMQSSPSNVSDMGWFATAPQGACFAESESCPGPKRQTACLSPDDAEAAHALGRYIMISGLPRTATPFQLKQLIKRHAEFRAIIVKGLAETGSIVVAFHDPREAWSVVTYFHSGPQVLLGGTSPVRLACSQIEKMAAEHLVNELEEWRQVFDESEPCIRIELEVPVKLSNMRSALEKIGPVYSIIHLAQSEKIFLAEYWDCRHASQAVKCLDGVNFENSVLHAHFAPSFGEPFSRRFPPASAAGANPKQSRRINVLSGMTPQLPSDAPIAGCDVFGPIQSIPKIEGQRGQDLGPMSWTLNQTVPCRPAVHKSLIPRPVGVRVPGRELGYQFRQREAERLTPVPRRSASRFIVSSENMVFPQRVKFGQDPRTTIMIKDVPNRLSRDELIKILEAVVPGGFDFVYLRFDFHNGCNLGYGFINFTSTQALYRFICLKVGKKWNMYSSEKVLQISYADTQGKQDLITKFRGSVVMRVHEQWRPVFFHSSGPLQGQREQVFEEDELSRHGGEASNWWFPPRPDPSTPSMTQSESYSYNQSSGYVSEYV